MHLLEIERNPHFLAYWSKIKRFKSLTGDVLVINFLSDVFGN